MIFAQYDGELRGIDYLEQYVISQFFRNRVNHYIYATIMAAVSIAVINMNLDIRENRQITRCILMLVCGFLIFVLLYESNLFKDALGGLR